MVQYVRTFEEIRSSLRQAFSVRHRLKVVVAMPRLGGSDDEEEGIPLMAPSSSRRRDREATAYATSSGHHGFFLSSATVISALKLFAMFMGVLVVRNMLVQVSISKIYPRALLDGPAFVLS